MRRLVSGVVLRRLISGEAALSPGSRLIAVGGGLAGLFTQRQDRTPTTTGSLREAGLNYRLDQSLIVLWTLTRSALSSTPLNMFCDLINHDRK